jgi:hypothetical protein
VDHAPRRTSQPSNVAMMNERYRYNCPPSRPRGAVGSGAAAIESAADSVVSRSRGCVGGLGWLSQVRLFVCPVRVPCPVSRVLEVTQTHIHIHTHTHSHHGGYRAGAV